MERSQKSFALGDIHPCGSPGGSSQLRAECLTEGVEPPVELLVRFGQAVERQVLDPAGSPVAELVVTGHRYTSGEETLEQEVRLDSLPNRTAAIRTAGSERAELTEDGVLAGTLLWRWQALHGTVEAWTEEVRPALHRVRVEVANRMEWDHADPGQNSMRTLRGTELVVFGPIGAFVSPRAHAAARGASLSRL